MTRIFGSCRICVVLGLLGLLIPVSMSHAAVIDTRASVVELVRLMGYGAGIHNFKNFVLRGRAVSFEAARSNFKRAINVAERLASATELRVAERRAAQDIRAVIKLYIDALDDVRHWHIKKWGIEEIDRAVVIDDAAAKAGLDKLRSKWRWSDFEEMEFQLGYGKAIHNFKNYVLRGHARYYTEALENFLAVDALIAGQLSLPELSDPRDAAEEIVKRDEAGVASNAALSKGVPSREAAARIAAVEEISRALHKDRAALEAVGRVARGYRDNLALIERMIAMQRPVRQIDLAIKVNDGPAKDALSRLRLAGSYLRRLVTARAED